MISMRSVEIMPSGSADGGHGVPFEEKETRAERLAAIAVRVQQVTAQHARRHPACGPWTPLSDDEVVAMYEAGEAFAGVRKREDSVAAHVEQAMRVLGSARR